MRGKKQDTGRLVRKSNKARRSSEKTAEDRGKKGQATLSLNKNGCYSVKEKEGAQGGVAPGRGGVKKGWILAVCSGGNRQKPVARGGTVLGKKSLKRAIQSGRLDGAGRLRKGVGLGVPRGERTSMGGIMDYCQGRDWAWVSLWREERLQFSTDTPENEEKTKGRVTRESHNGYFWDSADQEC